MIPWNVALSQLVANYLNFILYFGPLGSASRFIITLFVLIFPENSQTGRDCPCRKPNPAGN